MWGLALLKSILRLIPGNLQYGVSVRLALILSNREPFAVESVGSDEGVRLS